MRFYYQRKQDGGGTFYGNANMFSVEDREKLLKTKLTHVTPQQIVAPYYKKVEGLNEYCKNAIYRY